MQHNTLFVGNIRIVHISINNGNVQLTLSLDVDELVQNLRSTFGLSTRKYTYKSSRILLLVHQVQGISNLNTLTLQSGKSLLLLDRQLDRSELVVVNTGLYRMNTIPQIILLDVLSKVVSNSVTIE